MFAVDLLFWFVTGFSLLTLACSTLCVIYFCVRKTSEMLLAPLWPAPHLGKSRLRVWDALRNSPDAKRTVAALHKNARAHVQADHDPDAGATAGPWGPIGHSLSPEMARNVERIMAIGVGMRDVAGNPCPHPIAPRVALAIVEALQQHR